MALAPQFVSTPRTPVLSIANADGTAFRTLFSAALLGSRVEAVAVSNSDAANPYTVQVAIQKSGVDYVLGEVIVPAGAGTNGATKAASLLNATDIPILASTESNSLLMETGTVLRFRPKTTVSGANTLQFIGVAGDY